MAYIEIRNNNDDFRLYIINQLNTTNNMKIIGVAIVIIGLGMTLFTAITYFTREKVADLGVLEISRNHPHNLSWSPFFGLAIMVVGAFIILRNKKSQ